MLYKFYSFTGYTLDALANGSVYFSRRNQFNDPMDCNPPTILPDRERFDRSLKFCLSKMEGAEAGFQDRILSKSSRDYLFSLLSDKEFSSELETIADSVGVFCLTNRPHHPLMWGHYADGHKGFCVGFDIPDTEFVYGVDTRSFEGHSVHVKRVDYSKKPVDSLEILLILLGCASDEPEFRCNEGRLNSHSAEMILNSEGLKNSFFKYYVMHHLSHKHFAWSYEEELRVMALSTGESDNSGIRRLKQASIKEVIFGEKMPESQRVTIEKLLEKRGIEYKESVSSRRSWDLEFLPVQ